MSQIIKELEAQQTAVEAKIKELEELCTRKFNHPDYLLILADKRHWQHKLKAIEYKLNQVHLGLPILGYPDTNIVTAQMITNTNKNQPNN